MDNPVVPKFTTRSQYNNALSRKLRSRMRAADRYINHAPVETPVRLRAPYRASEWVDLPAADRAQHVRSILAPKSSWSSARSLSRFVRITKIGSH